MDIQAINKAAVAAQQQTQQQPGVQQSGQDNNNNLSLNGYLMALYECYKDVQTQTDEIDLKLNEELLLNSSLDAQQNVVQADQGNYDTAVQKLKTDEAAYDAISANPKTKEAVKDAAREAVLADENSCSNIESQIMNDQNPASFIQGQMSQVWQGSIDPAQQLIQADSGMFGSLVNTYVRAEVTR